MNQQKHLRHAPTDKTKARETRPQIDVNLTLAMIRQIHGHVGHLATLEIENRRLKAAYGVKSVDPLPLAFRSVLRKAQIERHTKFI